ncbi:MAG: hypothetical protein EAZ80_09080, partial [Runella slithyformis]
HDFGNRGGGGIELRCVIERGRRNQEILKQGQFSPVNVGEQVAIIYASINGVLDKVSVTKVKEFETEFIAFLRDVHPEVITNLAAGKLDDSVTDVIKKAGRELAPKYA